MRAGLKNLIAVLVLALLYATPTFAQTDDCANAKTTTDQVICFGALYVKADERLNAAYTAQRAGLDDVGKTLLRDAQRAWISFRDAECERQSDVFRGGTLARVITIDCLVNLTEQRADDLLSEGVDTEQAPEPTKTFWQEDTSLFGKFDCENYSQARLGLIPGRDPATFEAILTARLEIGDHVIDIPIEQGGNSLCGPDLSLTMTESASSCSVLRVDDGMCDAFFFSWNIELRTYMFERN